MKDKEELDIGPEVAKILTNYRNSIIREGTRVLEKALKRYPKGNTGFHVMLGLLAAQAEALGYNIATTATNVIKDPDKELEDFMETITQSVRTHAVRKYEELRPKIQ